MKPKRASFASPNARTHLASQFSWGEFFLKAGRSRNLRHAGIACLTLMFAGATAIRARENPDAAFDFAALQTRAAALATKPQVEQPQRVPESLRRLSYDEYRQIAFEEPKAFWKRESLPFHLQFFHPGFIQTHTVRINEVVDGRAREISFSAGLFNYRGIAGKIDTSTFPADMGFSGLRFLYPLNTPPHFSEVAVFQGASYFRALARNARYGLSARGLAINTAEPDGEEFPVFEEFWVERPARGATSLRLWALMDSRSVTGAYQFLITPGGETVIEVNAVIYRRAQADGGKAKFLGIAPLTSMFWFGKSNSVRVEDLRPEVHDSDGLSILTGAGEWIWRPLDNPRAVRTAAFSDEHPRGFGLIQRDRDFSDYEDIEAAYHLRPSVWVEPLGDWGRGEVRLVELPTPDETNDNIVAFWTPAELPPAGEALRVNYKLHWFLGGAAGRTIPPAGVAVSTRQGHSLTQEPELRRFWVDFAGDALAALPAEAKVEAVVTVGRGATLEHAGAEKNPFNNTWRAAFAIKPGEKNAPVELRCYLKNADEPGGGALTETWSYLWTP